MVNVWKIGSWPGVGRKNKKNIQKYIHDYALVKGFVGLGSDYLPDISDKNLEEIKILIRDRNKKDKTPISIGKRAIQVYHFANILKKDVILLYNSKSAYVGIAKENSDNPLKKPYYFVAEDDTKHNFVKDFDLDDRISHRIDVDWQFKEDSKITLFDGVKLTWNDTVHQVLEEDLDKIENKELNEYLRDKFKEER